MLILNLLAKPVHYEKVLKSNMHCSCISVRSKHRYTSVGWLWIWKTWKA